jgi:hypothetical protein
MLSISMGSLSKPIEAVFELEERPELGAVWVRRS